jgi:CheY-like chemotaxis protein
MRFKSDDGRRLAILIAADQADAAESLGWLLHLYGHEVTFARTGTEALEAATRTCPDVLIDLAPPTSARVVPCRNLTAYIAYVLYQTKPARRDFRADAPIPVL